MLTAKSMQQAHQATAAANQADVDRAREAEELRKADAPPVEPVEPPDHAQVDALRALSDEQLAARVSAARAQCEQLKREVELKQLAAIKAAEAFEATPNEKTQPAKEIAKQLASNARKELAKFEQESVPLFNEESRRKSVQRLETLRPMMDWRSKVDPKIAEIVALYQKFGDELYRLIESVASETAYIARHAEEANALEQRFGHGTRPYGAPAFGSALMRIREALDREIGRPEWVDKNSAQMLFNEQCGGILDASVRVSFKAKKENR